MVAIAAFGLSVLVAWLVTALGLPWVAPIARESPTLYPVRAIAALLWAVAAFARASGDRALDVRSSDAGRRSS